MSFPIRIEGCGVYAEAELFNDTDSTEIITTGNFDKYPPILTYYTYIIGINGYSDFNFMKDNSNKITPLPARSSDSLILLLSFNNGYREFENVIKIQLDTIKSYRNNISRIYIADSVGLIQFFDYKSKKTWSLIDY